MSEPQRNLIAEQAYAAAWSSWTQTADKETKRALEQAMDAQQEKIATGPADPRWQRFADSLPGYRVYWERVRREMEAMAKVIAKGCENGR